MAEDPIEIRSVIKFLWLQDKSNIQIYESINRTYGKEQISLRQIENRTKSLDDDTFSIFDKKRSGRPLKNELVDPISNLLEEDPYISTKKLAKKLNVDKKTVKRVLIEELHMVKIYFKWIPYNLTDKIRAKRIEIATQLLNFLSSASEQTLNRIMTQDEIWLYLNNPRRSMWTVPDKEAPVNVKQNIGAKKYMISVIWSRTGTKSVMMLPCNQKFNKEFFKTKVLGDYAKKYRTQGKYFHCDNARPHLVDEEFDRLKMIRLNHPPYSPDISPSDYFLFGYLRFKLEGFYFKNEKELLSEVKSILSSISSNEYKKAMDDWIVRLRLLIDSGGAYVK